jgi:hypothetical protein
MYARNWLIQTLCVELGKMPLITFWGKCLGDDYSMNGLASSFLYVTYQLYDFGVLCKILPISDVADFDRLNLVIKQNLLLRIWVIVTK